MVAPLAVVNAVPPVQMYWLVGEVVTVGLVVTFTVTVFCALHAPVVPVTVYIVVVVAVVVGLLSVVLLSPVPGLHK